MRFFFLMCKLKLTGQCQRIYKSKVKHLGAFVASFSPSTFRHLICPYKFPPELFWFVFFFYCLHQITYLTDFCSVTRNNQSLCMWYPLNESCNPNTFRYTLSIPTGDTADMSKCVVCATGIMQDSAAQKQYHTTLHSTFTSFSLNQG